jgi:hypothetical protein
MELKTHKRIEIRDSQQRRIGQITIEQREEALLQGQFTPGPDFPVVEHLFREFEEAVDAQALRVVDQLDTAISALGLHFSLRDGSRHLAVHDVQIWRDGGMTCQLCCASARAASTAV